MDRRRSASKKADGRRAPVIEAQVLDRELPFHAASRAASPGCLIGENVLEGQTAATKGVHQRPRVDVFAAIEQVDELALAEERLLDQVCRFA